MIVFPKGNVLHDYRRRKHRVQCSKTGIAVLEGHESACFGACFREMMSLKVRGKLIMLGLDRLKCFSLFLYVPMYGSCQYVSQPRITPAQTETIRCRI